MNFFIATRHESFKLKSAQTETPTDSHCDEQMNKVRRAMYCCTLRLRPRINIFLIIIQIFVNNNSHNKNCNSQCNLCDNHDPSFSWWRIGHLSPSQMGTQVVRASTSCKGTNVQMDKQGSERHVLLQFRLSSKKKRSQRTKDEWCEEVILWRTIAVFRVQGTSASHMMAAKVLDVISRLPGCSGVMPWAHTRKSK